MSEADAHATYRAVAAASGYPLPTVQMVRGALGLAPGTKLPSWWPHYVDPSSIPEGRLVGGLISLRALAAGLYPTTQDLMKCALLCLGRSAWNPGTLSSLDIANWCSRYDERAIWVFSRKWRSGGAYQYTVSNERERTSVYGIICKLIERTKALRSWLKTNRDAHPTPDIALRSPWLGMSDRVNLLLMTVDPGNSFIINRHLKSAIAKHNQSPDSKALVGDMNCTDFRDIAAEWTYRNSRYSMWITMVLLGHKHLSTTRIYVATRASRRESHAAVSSVMDDVFQQISESHRWDPTLTRAAVEGMDLSEDAIARLNSYRDQRTYDGSVCSDPFHPPRRIDPSHPGDGKTRCIQGHRCAAACCPNGHVFKESLSWLARRTAELEWLEQKLGAVRFSTSTEKEDLSELQRTLSQWPEVEVQRELQHWREKLADGSHRPLRFAGRR